MPGALFVVVAPSGAGKTSLLARLLKEEPNIRLSVSYTTRAPRPAEADGREYHFVDRATFQRMIGANEFLEHANVHGNLYGTSREWIEGMLRGENDVLLEIDWQGARQVRAMLPQMVGIFILPPSLAELRRRLQSRATESADAIERRLANAREEVSHVLEFEYIIVNEQFDAALADLKQVVAVIRTTPVSRAQQAYRIAKLLDEFR